MTLLVVINLHGAINSSTPVRKSLQELKVIRKFSASVVGDDAPTVGMLKLCKDYLAWSPVAAPLLADLLEKRGMVSSSHPLDSAALKKIGYKKHEDLASKMVKDQLRLSAVEGVLPFFRLSPPRGGFRRSLRKQFKERGTLGENLELEEIVRRML